jgi:hypothetical protein
MGAAAWAVNTRASAAIGGFKTCVRNIHAGFQAKEPEKSHG